MPTQTNTATKAMLDDAADALKIAKITMMMQKNTTFYTALLFSLKQTITDEVPTAATDGKTLLINPEFFCDLSPNVRVGLLAHEVLHVALDHMHRKGERDPKLWNMAADYVINAFLINAGYKLPDGGLYNREFDGQTTEEVYDALNKKGDKEKQALHEKCASGPDGNDVTYPEDATSGEAVSKEDVTKIVLRATTQAKSMGQEPGTVPGEVDIELQRTLNPPLPWEIILQNYLTEFAKDDYTFRRPNRRFLPKHYLPTAHSEAVCNLAIAVDTSCSVQNHEFNDFITKIDEIKRSMKPDKISVIAFDTKIKSVQEIYEHDDPMEKLTFRGRGGTRISPVHEWADENKPTVLIIFTDGEFTKTPPMDKSIPLVWLIYNNPEWVNDYGRVITYDIPPE